MVASSSRIPAAFLLTFLALGPALRAAAPPGSFAAAARAVKGAFDADARALLASAGVWEVVEEDLNQAGGGVSAAEDAEAARSFTYGHAAAGEDPRLVRAVARLDAQGFFRLGLPRALEASRKGHEVPEPLPGAGAYGSLDLRVFPSDTWTESLAPDEADEFAAMAVEIQRLQGLLSKDGNRRRGFHAKSHGNLKARLRVRDDLPVELRHGLFAAPGSEFECLVRYSNGVGIEQHDWKPDVRGLAVKVLGVDGPPLDGSEPGTQDFLATNQPASLARDARQFMAFARANVNPLKLPLVLFKELGLQEGGRILKVLGGFAFQRTRSVAASTYWTGARAYGPWAARFLFAPSGAVTAPRRKVASSYLRAELEQRVRRAEIRIDVLAHLYVNDRDTPIEDGATPWNEAASPPVKLAELVIPVTDLASAAAQATAAAIEARAFNPWNGLEAHRPLGHLMRARAAVYRASAVNRGATIPQAKR